jgi:hypothetical protein
MKRRFLLPVLLLPVLLLAALVFTAYPRLHKPLFRLRSHQAAEAATAQIIPQLRDGDLIFHTSLSAQSQAIQLATRSPYSHCGILYQKEGQWQVFEAVQPVKLTPLASWIARGEGAHFVTKRLRDAATALTPAALTRLKAAGQPLLGRRHDLYFGWDDDRIYCSESIWKVYERGMGRRIGQLQQLRDFDLTTPPCKPSCANGMAATCRWPKP